MNKDLTVGKPETVLSRFCLPLFGSIIFQQLYNIADSFVAGKFIGDNALAAVGNSYEITLIFIAFAFGCNIGCSVHRGAAVRREAIWRHENRGLYRADLQAAVLCAVLMAGRRCFSRCGLLHLINTPEEVFADSKLYLDIYILGLPFVFLYNVATGIFSALGDSKTPFIFLACSSLSNIAVDILFVTALRNGRGRRGVGDVPLPGRQLCAGAGRGIPPLLQSHSHEGKCARCFRGNMLGSFAVIAVPSILQQSFISGRQYRHSERYQQLRSGGHGGLFRRRSS